MRIADRPGVTVAGEREALGIWWPESEGAKFWLASSTPVPPGPLSSAETAEVGTAQHR